MHGLTNYRVMLALVGRRSYATCPTLHQQLAISRTRCVARASLVSGSKFSDAALAAGRLHHQGHDLVAAFAGERDEFALRVAKQTARQPALVAGREHDHAIAALGDAHQVHGRNGDLFGRTLHGEELGDELLMDQPSQAFLAPQQPRGDLEADPRAVAVGDGDAVQRLGDLAVPIAARARRLAMEGGVEDLGDLVVGERLDRIVEDSPQR